MDSITQVKEEIIVRLTAKEAIWLKAVMQNAPSDPADESVEEAEMRRAMFEALPGFDYLRALEMNSTR